MSERHLSHFCTFNLRPFGQQKALFEILYITGHDPGDPVYTSIHTILYWSTDTLIYKGKDISWYFSISVYVSISLDPGQDLVTKSSTYINGDTNSPTLLEVDFFF